MQAEWPLLHVNTSRASIPPWTRVGGKIRRHLFRPCNSTACPDLFSTINDHCNRSLHIHDSLSPSAIHHIPSPFREGSTIPYEVSSSGFRSVGRGPELSTLQAKTLDNKWAGARPSTLLTHPPRRAQSTRRDRWPWREHA